MRLGLVFGYSGAQVKLPMDLIREAEALGYESAWSAEAWGSDAVTPVAWVLAQTTRLKAGTAIMQMAARTPSMTAMTAMTLDQLSGGRLSVHSYACHAAVTRRRDRRCHGCASCTPWRGEGRRHGGPFS